MKDLEKQLLPQELTLTAIVTSFHEKEKLRKRKQKEEREEKIRQEEEQFRCLVRSTLKTMLDEGFKDHKIGMKEYIIKESRQCNEIVAEFNEPDVFLFLKSVKDNKEVVVDHELQIWTKQEIERERLYNILLILAVLLIMGGGVLWEHVHKTK